MKGVLMRTGLILGVIHVGFTHAASTTAQDGNGELISRGSETFSDGLDIPPRSKKSQYLLKEDTVKVLQAIDELELGTAADAKGNAKPSSASEYWREVNVVFEAPTPVSDASSHCGMLITSAPILLARQDDNGELAALSNSAAAASRSASAGIANAEISASNAIASVSRTASASISSATSSASSVSSSASSALSSISSRLSSIESSASSAVSLADSNASSALAAASVLVQAASGSVDAAGSSFLVAAAKITSAAQSSVMEINAAATQLITQNQAQVSKALAISSTNAIIAIVVSIFGSSLLTFLAFFFIIRYRKKHIVDKERNKYTEDRRRDKSRSHRDSRSSIGSYYKDEKGPVSVAVRERSKSRGRHGRDRSRERSTRREKRKSDGEADRYEKSTSTSKTRVEPSHPPYSPAQSFSDYSTSPHDSFSPKSRTKASLSEIYPTPKTPQSPQRKLYSSTTTSSMDKEIVKKPDKAALLRKPDRLDMVKARKAVISVDPPTSSTANNLSTWLQNQTERDSIYNPVFGNANPNQPVTRGGLERPTIVIPKSVQGEIVDLGRSDSERSNGSSGRDSIATVFPDAFLTNDDSEAAEIANGKRSTTSTYKNLQKSSSTNATNSGIAITAARDVRNTRNSIRDSNFPFKKSTAQSMSLRGVSGLPSNPRVASGLPSNPRGRGTMMRDSVAESVAYETFEGVRRKVDGEGTMLGVPGDGNEMVRVSQVGRAS